jgi:hypothetical protein
MRLKTVALATAFAAMTSLALAQPAPIGSSADFGNGAVINRGPVTTTGEDLDFRTNRSSASRSAARHRRARACAGDECFAKNRRRHVAEHRH